MNMDQQLSLDGVITDMDETDLVWDMEKRLFLKVQGQYRLQAHYASICKNRCMIYYSARI